MEKIWPVAFLSAVFVFCYWTRSLNYATIEFDERASRSITTQHKISYLTTIQPKINFSILTVGFSAGLAAFFTRNETFSGCEFSNCFATVDKNYYGENNQDMFDALLIDRNAFAEKESANDLLQFRRSPHQLYVLRTIEASWRRNFLMIDQQYLYSYFFNYTWTINKDSNITDSYGPFFRHKDEPFDDPSFDSKGISIEQFVVEKESKTKLALWVVSHCNTTIRREEYVQELQKYMDIDVFGKCSNRSMTCAEIGNCTEAMAQVCDVEVGQNDACVRAVSLRYKFYLAFENSRCDNYWTEKLSRAFSVPIVPIVMGGMNYTEILPREAFINVDDYSSPQQLAEYLKYLDSNWEEYVKFFDWRNDYVMYRRQSHCALCKALNNPWKIPHAYENITRWFYFRNDGSRRCHDSGPDYIM